MGGKGDAEPLLSEKSVPKQGTVTAWVAQVHKEDFWVGCLHTGE